MRTYRIRLLPPIISQELALYQRLIETLQIDKKTCTQHMKKIKLLCSYEFGMSCFLRFFIFCHSSRHLICIANTLFVDTNTKVSNTTLIPFI
jgi:hypothetical protein